MSLIERVKRLLADAGARPAPRFSAAASRIAGGGQVPTEPFDPAVTGGLAPFPPPGRWDEWREPDGRRCTLVPTAAGGHPNACGLLAYVDLDTLGVVKFEGNPLHPGSRGRVCPECASLVNAVRNPDRLRRPLRRVVSRGDGFWEPVTWPEALDAIAAKLREAILAGRTGEIVCHAGPPAADGAAAEALAAWGADARASRPAGGPGPAGLGYALWTGCDGLTADFANARCIVLVGDDLDRPASVAVAERIVEGKARGAKLVVLASHLSNTASLADLWLPAWPGTETAILLAIARLILDEALLNREFVRAETNWAEWLRVERGAAEPTFDAALAALAERYAPFTPEYAGEISGVPPALIEAAAREIGGAGGALATHLSGAGTPRGWLVARALLLLNVLTGSVGTVGGVTPVGRDEGPGTPPERRLEQWNELLWPREFPLAGADLAPLLPQLLKAGRGRLAAYITRGDNPIRAFPDGFAWIEALRDEQAIELHVALTPTWDETAWYADYVLPVRLPAEQHGVEFGGTDGERWVALRQPPVSVATERLAAAGRPVAGISAADDVWEEDAVWIELAWRIDPDGALGIRRAYESPYRPGEPITVEERYRHLFETAVPGLPERAAVEALTPLAYMRRYGAYRIMPADPPAAPAPAAPSASEPAPAPGDDLPGQAAGAPTPAPDTSSADAEPATPADSAPVGPTGSDLAATPGDAPPDQPEAPPPAPPTAPEPVEPPAPVAESARPPDAYVELAAAGAIPTAPREPSVEVTEPIAVPGGVDEQPALTAEGELLPATGTASAAPAPPAAPPEPAAPVAAGLPAPRPAPARPTVYPTPSGKLELYSTTLRDWGWPEHALPGYVEADVPLRSLVRVRHEFLLVPTLAAPILPAGDGGDRKWLLEIGQANPLWLNPADAEALGLATGDLARVETAIGHFVTWVWLTEAVRSGAVGCFVGPGRWRRQEDAGNNRLASRLADLRAPGVGTAAAANPAEAAAELPREGVWTLRELHGVEPFESGDPDTARLRWHDAGVPVALALAPNPDPLSGEFVLPQRVTIAHAREGDSYGDVAVDTRRARAIARDGLAATRPAPGPDQLRRPPWLPRAGRPSEAAYRCPAPPEPPAVPAAAAEPPEPTPEAAAGASATPSSEPSTSPEAAPPATPPAEAPPTDGVPAEAGPTVDVLASGAAGPTAGPIPGSPASPAEPDGPVDAEADATPDRAAGGTVAERQ